MSIRELAYHEIPRRLVDIPEPVKKLFVLGRLPPQEIKNLVIVGSRNHSDYGKQALKDIIAGLVGYPINIVSGLALGIDTIVHEEALRHGMYTTAFPGSGLLPEAIHPKTNIPLTRKIIDSGGCLVSEFDPNFKATLYSFPKRNRLMAAYADAVLIIEAEEKSGTLITARLALDYNRDVLVVPGSIYSESSRGTNWLLSQGATPVLSAKDVLYSLGFETRPEPKPYRTTEEERVILELLEIPLRREEILDACDNPAEEVNTLLRKMELRNLIIEQGGLFRKK